MEKDTINVLYLDDEVQNLFAFKASFRKNFKIFTAQNPHDAIAHLNENEIHVIMVEQRMPLISGLDFLKLVGEEFPDVINILLTGYIEDTDFFDKLVAKGEIFRYVLKPWSPSEIKAAVEDAYKVYAFLEQRNKEIQGLKHELTNNCKASIANLEGLVTLAQFEINDAYALTDYFRYMSQSIESLKSNLEINMQKDLLSQN